MKQSEEEWLKKNFPYMRNAFCAMYLGKHPRTIVRIARKFGLVKSPAFIKLERDASLKKAAEANSKRLRGTYPVNLQKWNNRKKTN